MDNEFAVFISYNWDIKPQVEAFHKKLDELSIRAWRDDKDMKNTNSPLVEQLAKAIKKSKIFLCCFTQKYSESRNCNAEINYANEIGKPLLVLAIEKPDVKNLDGIGFIIAGTVRINCYKHRETWFRDDFDAIHKAIKDNLDDIEKKFEVGDEIYNSRYKLVQKIGEGAYSFVYKVEDMKERNKLKAMKQFKNIDFQEKSVAKEVSILKKVQHENIIKYTEFFSENSKYGKIFFIVTEYYEDGTLEEEIALQKATNNPLPQAYIIGWSIQLIAGIEYLHKHEEVIIHGDIKPANIFLSRRKLILGDMGHAKCLMPSVLLSKSKTRTATIGTASYNAPELIEQIGDYTKKIDIWSFGCVVYEMVKLDKLFNGRSIRDIERQIEDFNIRSINSRLNGIPPLLRKAIEYSLIKDPNERLSARRVHNLLLIEIVEITEIERKNGSTNRSDLQVTNLPPLANNRVSSAANTKKKEIISIHLGQPGIQIGTSFWETLCTEHGINLEGKTERPTSNSSSCRAFFSRDQSEKFSPRALFIDSDPYLIEDMRYGPYRKLVNPSQLVSGYESCSIYSKGYYSQGKDMLDKTLELIRRIVEDDSNLDGFLLFTGLSGGMSGFKSLLIKHLSEVYPKQKKIEFAIAPSVYQAPKSSQNVIKYLTSNALAPYNTIFQYHGSLDYLDGSITLDNGSIYSAMDFNRLSSVTTLKNINKIIAQLASTLTSTFRYESTVNSSMDQVHENLSVAKRLHHYMVSSSYLNNQQYFNSYSKLMTYLFEPKNQLLSPNLLNGRFLNSCLVHVGQRLSDEEVNRSVDQQKQAKSYVWDSKGAIKTGFSAQPSEKLAGCLLTSSSAMSEHFSMLNQKFDLLYNKKAFVHWFVGEGMDESKFKEARDDLANLQREYDDRNIQIIV